MIKHGIYITANDKVIDQAIALLNSIRLHDPDTPIILIPYDNNYQQVHQKLAQNYGVQLYQDLEFIERLSQQLHQIFGTTFFARPNQFRKQACWFGPFEQFLYIDTDIVVFEKIANCLNYLSEYDFICCDYQHKGGIRNVFSNQVIEKNIFTPQELQDIFNCGFWGSKKNLITEQDLYNTFTECATHPEYFDFSQKTSDQPIINYLILKKIPQRFNIVKRPGGAPGSWGGSLHFQTQNFQLIDPKVNQPLQYIHWAGIRIEPGCPYWEIWEHYRYLHEPKPISYPSKKPESLWQKLKKIVKKIIK